MSWQGVKASAAPCVDPDNLATPQALCVSLCNDAERMCTTVGIEPLARSGSPRPSPTRSTARGLLRTLRRLGTEVLFIDSASLVTMNVMMPEDRDSFG